VVHLPVLTGRGVFPHESPFPAYTKSSVIEQITIISIFRVLLIIAHY